MTLTIDLPDELMANLFAQERASGRSAAAIAAEGVAEYLREDLEEFPMDTSTIASIQKGISDVDAGRTYTLEETSERADAALAARLGLAKAV